MTKEEFMQKAGQYYEEYASLPTADNFYDYEKNFVGMFHRLGQELMQSQLLESSKSVDRRKKKL